MFDVVFSFSHRCEKCDFICRIAIINVVWKSIDRLKNLFFNAHDARLAETEAVRNAGKSKFATGEVAVGQGASVLARVMGLILCSLAVEIVLTALGVGPWTAAAH